MNRLPFFWKKEMTRREFVKKTAVGTAGLALMDWPKSEVKANQKYPYWGKVVTAQDDSATDGAKINTQVIGPLLDEAVNALTDGRGWEAIFPVIKSGDKVAIKINAFRRGKLITHEEILDVIVSKLIDLGVQPANLIIFDGGGTRITSLELSSIRAKGVRVLNTSGEGFDDNASVSFTKEYTVSLSRIITDSTYLINVPVLKNHRLAGITFSLKSHVGSINHPNLIHSDLSPWGEIRPGSIATINNLPAIKEKTRLIVGDVLFGIYQGGPAGTPEFAYNGLIVGTDPAAVDNQGRIILDEERAKHGLKPLIAQLLDEAAQLGVGASPNDVKVISLHRKKIG